MEYLTIRKLNVNKLSEANSSSWWKWLKKLFIGETIVKFTVFKYRRTGSILFLLPPQFVFSFSKHSVALLWLGITNQRFHGKYSVHDVSLRMGRKEKLKANRRDWKEVIGQSYRFRFIIVIARVIERVDALTWTVLPRKRFLLERLKHVFFKEFLLHSIFRAGTMSVSMVLPKSPLHISISWPTKV